MGDLQELSARRSATLAGKIEKDRANTMCYAFFAEAKPRMEDDTERCRPRDFPAAFFQHTGNPRGAEKAVATLLWGALKGDKQVTPAAFLSWVPAFANCIGRNVHLRSRRHHAGRGHNERAWCRVRNGLIRERRGVPDASGFGSSLRYAGQGQGRQQGRRRGNRPALPPRAGSSQRTRR